MCIKPTLVNNSFPLTLRVIAAVSKCDSAFRTLVTPKAFASLRAEPKTIC